MVILSHLGSDSIGREGALDGFEPLANHFRCLDVHCNPVSGTVSHWVTSVCVFYLNSKLIGLTGISPDVSN